MGLVSSWRVYSLQGYPLGESGFIRQLIIGLPGWILWAAATPFIYWLSGLLPFTIKTWPKSLLLQIISATLFSFAYIAFFLLLENFLGVGLRLSPDFKQRYLSYAQSHYFAVFLLYTGVAFLFYFFRSLNIGSSKKGKEFLNSILVKTRYGYVLVEIERFQYVRNAVKKVLFHTGRRKHLSREMVEIDPTSIVEERKYDPQRQIVIDLGKIRRADQIGENKFHFYIGYSHQLILEPELFRLLKAWLPSPRKREKAEYF